MDAELLVRIAGTAVGLAAGAGVKHRTRINHKIAGPAANVAIGAGVVGLANLFGADVPKEVAVEIGASTEFVYQGGKSLVRGAKGIGRVLRGLFS